MDTDTTIFNQAGRRALLRWCRSRHVKCVFADAPRGAALLLAGNGPATLLCGDKDGWMLLTEAGEALAAASTLPALLDAMDAGIFQPAA